MKQVQLGGASLWPSRGPSILEPFHLWGCLSVTFKGCLLFAAITVVGSLTAVFKGLLPFGAISGRGSLIETCKGPLPFEAI